MPSENTFARTCIVCSSKGTSVLSRGRGCIQCFLPLRETCSLQIAFEKKKKKKRNKIIIRKKKLVLFFFRSGAFFFFLSFSLFVFYRHSSCASPLLSSPLLVCPWKQIVISRKEQKKGAGRIPRGVCSQCGRSVE